MFGGLATMHRRRIYARKPLLVRIYEVITKLRAIKMSPCIPFFKSYYSASH